MTSDGDACDTATTAYNGLSLSGCLKCFCKEADLAEIAAVLKWMRDPLNLIGIMPA